MELCRDVVGIATSVYVLKWQFYILIKVEDGTRCMTIVEHVQIYFRVISDLMTFLTILGSST